ncbi:Rossmann-like and DUF2520 domain-containing protein [Moraxella sp. ZY210820]|uniref:Rossmann-like and DUF2520 domain-containing protein n=1 Tax=unclassified Moraxella TaxID=2685852 RepID=UPI002730AA52|nr:Rossmann-like and DUF2520 domain-containing protein [Moraxella sp. ZY210820]WLF83139.1 DUF2520 domain-containing protein [Moraxella sp. ZY210820]
MQITVLSSYKLSIIGTGQVAHHLAWRLHQVGINIAYIYGRQLDKAQQLAMQVQAQAINDLSVLSCEDVSTSQHIIIIAVSDSVIETVIKQLAPHLSHALVVHTSGSTHIDVLKQYYARVGVFYPLQTFSFGREIDWYNTPLLLETATDDDKILLHEIAHKISNVIYDYDSEQRFVLHLSAVIACNFSNLCYDLSKQLLDSQAVDYQLLLPLILETAQKASQFEPQQVQTGPAKRGDITILQRHQAMLQQLQRDDIAQLYRMMSEMIMQRHSK